MGKRSLTLPASTLILILVVFATKAVARASDGADATPLAVSHKARNIIFMVPDGMSLANVTATRIYLNGPDGAPLNLERTAFIGYQRTHSSDSTVTDSAAAASAWACGEKFENGSICYRDDGPQPESILERARDLGKATGLVATSTITHATPAAFGAHVSSRGCETEIARQFVQETEVDLMLGGGRATFDRNWPDPCGTKGDFINLAIEEGYRFVETSQGLEQAVEDGVRRVLGLFSEFGMTPEIRRSPGTTEPRLPEMTGAALDILEDDPGGFFLVVEGAQVDWAQHANDREYMLGEMIAFDEAVGVVLDWLDIEPARAAQTLLVIVSDHETGGFAINGPNGRLSQPGEKVTAGWTTRGHTAVDTIIWSQGPRAWRLARPVDNTDLYDVMLEALQPAADNH
ncbi:MAG: alkaline phosphatase [Acidobacteriota bacterium]|nr:MAG: alkaline phosphatase [Acidobacteriota bacterium]